MPEASAITAILGPTNTGKTHRAVARMLEHQTGMIGLPLRLLAREVYDRITAKVGEKNVALVTGEEKRVPRRPSYWVCTVESMPVDLEVEFLAVDEVQLAAHAQRGHVFTDRLLRARGTKETYFLGSDTVRGVLGDLVPTARIEKHPRLSTLRAAPAQKLSKLPPRSAVVAFSMQQVVELGERLRALRGGCAVVMGALSPRTRNAQVALFQAGEVDCLVATDAIGMGLNLDIDHVAFAALRKFDGKEVRELEAAELGQIAGRAGRHLRDGTFGVLSPLVMPADLEARLVAHRFDPVRRLRYRSADLDFSSISALSASLREPPRRSILLLDSQAEDLAALEALGRDAEIRARADSAERVELLWDVCRIPDFRKLLFESHVALLHQVFLQLAGSKGVLDEEWMREAALGIDDPTGDLDTLMAKIASIRTWTYISNQSGWVKDESRWQERTREIEDRLSDALHERLVQRFVDRRSGRKVARERAAHPARSNGDAPRATPANHPFAELAKIRLPNAARPPLAEDDEDDFVEKVVAAPHESFAIDETGTIVFVGADEPAIVGKLVAGVSLLAPDARVDGGRGLGAGARSRVHRRLVALSRDAVNELLEPLRGPASRGLSAPARGVVYQVEQGLGTALVKKAIEQIANLDAADRVALSALGIVIGKVVIRAPKLASAKAVAIRSALVRAQFGEAAPPPPRSGATSFRAARFDAGACLAIGYPVFGPRAVRADIAEKAATILASSEPTDFLVLAGTIGCPTRQIESIAFELASWHEASSESAPSPARLR
jgi:ATP-dependent RNA helicase SUPV3L1/SUV3